MEFVQSVQNAMPTYVNVYIAVFRYIAPILAMLILSRAIFPLLRFRREPEIWAWLCMPDGKKTPITHWENIIGRDRKSDVLIDLATVSRTHAVLTRYDDGSWSISNVERAGDVLVNGERITIRALKKNDIITIGGLEMTLQPISAKQEKRLAQIRTSQNLGSKSRDEVVARACRIHCPDVKCRYVASVLRRSEITASASQLDDHVLRAHIIKHIRHLFRF